MGLRNLLIQSRRVYPDANYLDPETVRHNRRAWVRARLRLGDRWILAQRAEKIK